MLVPRIVLAFTLILGVSALPFAASADAAADGEVVVSASRAAPLPTEAEQAKAKADAEARAAQAARPVTTQEQIVAWLADAPSIRRNGSALDDSPLWSTDDQTSPRQVHSEMGVSIGTGGYRSGYISSLIPIGENGTLGIAISQTDYGQNGYYDYGYGHGYPRLRRGGTSQSVAVSLDMASNRRNMLDTPAGCAPGFRDGDRYIEPVWVSRMNNYRSCTILDRP